jgi:hypothetical protein
MKTAVAATGQLFSQIKSNWMLYKTEGSYQFFSPSRRGGRVVYGT